MNDIDDHEPADRGDISGSSWLATASPRQAWPAVTAIFSFVQVCILAEPLAFAADAVIYLWDFKGRQMANELLQDRGATVRDARTPVAWLNADLFCIFGHAF